MKSHAGNKTRKNCPRRLTYPVVKKAPVVCAICIFPRFPFLSQSQEIKRCFAISVTKLGTQKSDHSMFTSRYSGFALLPIDRSVAERTGFFISPFPPLPPSLAVAMVTYSFLHISAVSFLSRVDELDKLAGLQSMGLHSSASRALQCEREGHGLESR